MTQKIDQEKLATSYTLDDADRIVAIGGPWDTFANENEGYDVCAENVRGHSIWNFVSGDTTRMWLDAIFQRARMHNQEIERFYRCDSPELKRFMLMRIVPLPDGMLQVEHVFLSMEQRAAPVQIRHAAKGDELIYQRCSICGRIHDDSWREPQAGHDNDASYGIIVVYTVCEDCREQN